MIKLLLKLIKIRLKYAKTASLLNQRYGCKLSLDGKYECVTAENFIIGEGCQIAEGNYITLWDEKDRPGRSKLLIGARTYIGQNNNIRAAGAEIKIGANCLIAQNITIVGSNHGVSMNAPMRDQPFDLIKNGVEIKDDVWIGANCVVLPGVVIGEGAIVGAGSVVTKSLAPYSVNCGVPCKEVRKRS